MKAIHTISIEAAIVHLVDSKKSVLTLSSRQLKVPKNSDIAAYFAGHIKNSLHDTSAKTATFADTSKLKIIAQTALLSPSKFVEASQSIAKHLFDSSDKRISSGAVATCLYASPEQPKVKRFLAILKLDPADGFHPVEKKDKKGNVYVEFEKVEDVVPSTEEKLLKCAFIRPASRPDFDLVVLDRQATGTQEPAHFFVQKFLGADYFGDASEMTKKFYTTGVNTVESLRPTIGHKKAENIRSAINAAIAGNTIDVKQWASNLNVSKVAKAKIQADLSDAIPDGSFEVHEPTASKMSQRRAFKGAYGFRMVVNSGDFERVVKKRDNKNGYEEILIHVPNFEEVTR